MASMARPGPANERLRRGYRPERVRILFVGEAPPASGRFFYAGDSGLYRAIRDAFGAAFPGGRPARFLDAFRARGCYLVDLCPRPVDRLGASARQRARRSGEARLAGFVHRTRPEAVVVVVRSIAPNVRRALARAGWTGRSVELAYPGRWKRHRDAFLRDLPPFLRGEHLPAGETSHGAPRIPRLGGCRPTPRDPGRRGGPCGRPRTR